MNIDAAVRYTPVVRFLNKKNDDSVVLEVGSGTNGIADFYKGKVLGIDSSFSKTKAQKKSNIAHKRGLITKIPIESEKYNYLVCLDTFEHLISSDRQIAFSELLRVTKKDGYIILGSPSGYLSHLLEVIMNILFKLIEKKNHPWLIEHLEYGLPDLDKIVTNQRSSSLRIVKIIHNFNLFIWFKYHLMFTVFGRFIPNRIKKTLEGIFLFLALNVHLPPFYRRIYIIQK